MFFDSLKKKLKPVWSKFENDAMLGSCIDPMIDDFRKRLNIKNATENSLIVAFTGYVAGVETALDINSKTAKQVIKDMKEDSNGPSEN